MIIEVVGIVVVIMVVVLVASGYRLRVVTRGCSWLLVVARG